MNLHFVLQFIRNTAQDWQRECMITGNVIVFEGRIDFVPLLVFELLTKAKDKWVSGVYRQALTLASKKAVRCMKFLFFLPIC